MRIANIIMFCAAGMIATAASCFGQSTADESPLGPRLTFRCGTVSILSRNADMPAVLVADKLRQRGEFVEAGLALADAESSATADIAIVLSGNAHDTVVYARRRADGEIGRSTLFALGEYPGMVAGTVVDTLHQLCPTVTTTSRWRRMGREPLPDAAAAQLAAAASLSVVSHTSWMDEATLASAFSERPDVQASRIAIHAGAASNDLRLEITHDLSRTIVYGYALYGRNNKRLLGGSVAALSEKAAAGSIVRALSRQFARYRPSFTTTASKPVAGVEPRTFRVRLVTSDPRTTGLRLDMALDGERLVARDRLGHVVLNIEAPDLEDFDTWAGQDPVLPYPEALIDSIVTAPNGFVAVVGTALLGGYAGVAALLVPLEAREHTVDIAWHDGDFYQSAILQVEGHDVGAIKRALQALLDSGSAPRPARGMMMAQREREMQP